MKSIHNIWIIVSWIIVWAGLLAFSWATCLLAARSDWVGCLLYTGIAIALWIVSNQLQNWKCRCPYCGGGRQNSDITRRVQSLCAPTATSSLFTNKKLWKYILLTTRLFI